MIQEKLSGVPLLVFANKQDLISALSTIEISQGLNLHSIRDRQWQIYPCSAKEGTGLSTGLEFIAREIHAKSARIVDSKKNPNASAEPATS